MFSYSTFLYCWPYPFLLLPFLFSFLFYIRRRHIREPRTRTSIQTARASSVSRLSSPSPSPKPRPFYGEQHVCSLNDKTFKTDPFVLPLFMREIYVRNMMNGLEMKPKDVEPSWCFPVRLSVGEWRPTLLVYGKLVYFTGFVRLYVFILFVSDYILCYFG